MELIKVVVVDCMEEVVVAHNPQEMVVVAQYVLFGQVMLDNFLQLGLLMSRALTSAKINILSSTRDQFSSLLESKR
jgi:hypothetical protein